MRFGYSWNVLCNHTNRFDQENLPHNSQGKFSEELHANILFCNINSTFVNLVNKKSTKTQQIEFYGGF
eukprot:UN22513